MPIEIGEQLTYTIDTAAADAMIFGYAASMDPQRNPRANLIHRKDIAIFTEVATASQCSETSARSAYALWAKTPGLFPRTFLMQSVLLSENLDPLMTEDTIFTRNFFRHFIWGAQAIDGRFLFGSPNNAKLSFMRAGYQNPLTTIHEGETLPDALQKLDIYEGSYWPDREFIEQILSEEQLLPRLIAVAPNVQTIRTLRLNEEDFQELEPHIPDGKQFLFIVDCLTATTIIASGKPDRVQFSLEQIPYHLLASDLQDQ